MEFATFKKAVAIGVFTILAQGLLAVNVSAANDTKPGKGIAITPIFPTIAEERFRGEVAVAGLKELGYDVKQPKEADFPAMYIAISYGDADFTVHNWEHLHKTFYEKAGGDSAMVKVGQIMTGVLQGYMVDKKTAEEHHIKSLSDLKKPEIAKLFDTNGDGKADLIGCTPGWGCELIIEHHMKAYGLEPTVNNNRGAYFALMADAITRFQQGKPILFYTWTPQWIANVLVEGRDVVWLPVSFTSLPDKRDTAMTEYQGKNLGFPLDTVNSVMNKEYADKNPAAREFLAKIRISTSDESEQNYKMQKGESSKADIQRHAAEWIKLHQEEFNGWLASARTAASKD